MHASRGLSLSGSHRDWGRAGCLGYSKWESTAPQKDALKRGR